jgi:nucleoside-diphosphate-sugar epimerase
MSSNSEVFNGTIPALSRGYRRFLVTGGRGFIGSHLVRALVAADADEVIVFDNGTRRCAAREQPFGTNVRLIDADIRDRAALKSAMLGVDVVFHLAAQSNVMGAVADLEGSFSTNVIGTFNVFAAAHSHGVRRVVFTSSREVYGETASIPVDEAFPLNPKNAYGVSKAAGEHYAQVFRDGGLPISVLRLSNVYGPGDAGRVIPLFIDAAMAGHPLVLYGGQQVLDFVWIEEVVRMLVKCGLSEAYLAEPMNIGSGLGIMVRELAERVIALTHSSSALNVLPPREVEVSRFVANVRCAMNALALRIPDDPLFGLPSVIASCTRETAPHAEQQPAT